LQAEQEQTKANAMRKPKTLSELKKKSYKREFRPLTEARKIRDTGRYQRFRSRFRKKHPICCDPLSIHPNEVKQIEHVHHIIGVNERPDLALCEDNCAPLCTECHGRIEGMERTGKPTQHLFKERYNAKVG